MLGVRTHRAGWMGVRVNRTGEDAGPRAIGGSGARVAGREGAEPSPTDEALASELARASWWGE